MFLLGIGALLLVLLVSASVTEAGAFGRVLADGMHTAFGAGAVVVPLVFIVVGGLILWQERYVDAPITGANMVGVAAITVVVLGMLETKNLNRLMVRDPRDGEGGGVIGVLLNRALVNAFGVPGTWTVLILLFVLAVLLTFNVTLRQAVRGVWHGLASVAHLLLADRPRPRDPLAPEPVPFSHELNRKPLLRKLLPAPKDVPQLPPPPALTPAAQAEENVMLTPIAERRTQASLFQGRPKLAVPASAVPDKARGKGKAASAEDEGIAELDTSGSQQAWPLPTLTIFDDFVEGEVDDNEKRAKARVIEDTLSSFRIEAQVVGMNPGPAVTQYQLQPAVGVKVSKITSLERDLALALSAPSIRIEAPIPGTPYIGIEIPNNSISSVSMKEVMDTDEIRNHKGKLKIGLGKDVSGTPVVADLAKTPHLLIAGATGSGKSVAVNSIVAMLLYQHTPDQLKFIMIDPKMVELIVYNHIPHLLAPVVTELERVVSLLKWSVREMERRYKLLAQKGFRNIESYNKEAHKRPDLEPLPYIVVIIDELADLMMMAPDEVETLICRLAQMARAIGIHLILATQRPSVDVVTGLIKANFPTRMAFAVTSQIDSRVILDTAGAEQLLGRGDMLYLASDAPKPIRVQGTYVSDREIERLVTFWRAAQRPDAVNAGTEGRSEARPVPLKPRPAGEGDDAPMITVSALPSGSVEQLDPGEQDELLPKAIQLTTQHDRISASLLQRRLRIGYSKAAQLIELLEQQGFVGPAEGSRSREVLRDE